MTVTLIGIRVGILLIVATVAAGLADSASLEEPASDAPLPNAPLVKKPRMDVTHPIRIGQQYYPKQSVRNHEQGTCYLSLYVAADGSVPAVQLLKSSGYPLLDRTCFERVAGIAMLPGSVDGVPRPSWYDFPINWVLTGAGAIHPPPLEKSSVPRVADGYELKVGEKYYPEAARAKHDKGYCVVHMTVGSTGTAVNPTITRSTGSTVLDQACLTAVQDARFKPTLQDGQPVADSTDIAIYW